MNATLEKSTVMKIELPRSSSTAQEKKKDELVITVNKDGKVFLDKDTDPVPLEKLTEKINVFLGPPDKREPGKNTGHHPRRRNRKLSNCDQSYR